MKNTLIPLDMIFIRADGTIARIAANTVPLSLEPVPSRRAGGGGARNRRRRVGRARHQAPATRSTGKQLTLGFALTLAALTRAKARPMGIWSRTSSPGGTARRGAPRLFTRRHGEEVGRDEAGNVYFQHKKDPARRWVIYDGTNDGSRVPPGWNAWLRGTIDELPDKALPPAPHVRAAAARQSDRHAWRPFGPAGRLAASGVRAGLDRRLPGVDARLSVTRARRSCRCWRWSLLAAAATAAEQAAEQAMSAVTVDVPRAAGRAAGVTPMAERVAVLGLLNKRNGIVRDLTLKPGQAVRVQATSIVRLRACETTAPWENEKLTGAFVQLDVQQPDRQLAAGLLGLAVQGKPVAQRRRAPGLRRLAQELRDDISGRGPARRRRRSLRATGRAPRSRAAAARRARGRRAGADAGRADAGAAPSRRRRRRAPPTTTRHKSSRLTVDRAERGEVAGHELAVEQGEAADLQPRDQPGQRDLRGVGHPAEHAFAEEGAAELDAVEPADQLAVRRASTSIEWAWPAAWRPSVARSISALIQVSSRSAQARDDLGEGAVAGDGETARAERPARASATGGSRRAG